jgi:type II secretory pathway pseudopilin PulG
MSRLSPIWPKLTPKKSLGFSQADALLTIACIGVLSLVAIPIIVNMQEQHPETIRLTQRTEIVNSIEQALQSYQVEAGALSQNASPADILQRTLNSSATTDISTDSAMPAECAYLGTPATRFLHPSRQWEIIAANTWHQNATNQTVSSFCVRNVKYPGLAQQVDFLRDGELIASANNAGGEQNTLETNPSSGTLQNSTLENVRAEGFDLSNDPSIPNPPQQPPPLNPTNNTTVSPLTKVFWASREKTKEFNHRGRFNSIVEYFGSFYNPKFVMGGGYDKIHLFDEKMTLVEQISFKDMIPEIKVSLDNIPQSELDRINWTKGTKDISFSDANELGNHLKLPGCVGRMNVSAQLNCVMFREIARDPSGKKVLNSDGSIKTLGNFNGITWKKYNLDVGMSALSPVKISLVGKNAIPSGRDSFDFDADGFNKDGFPVFKTTGGLEPDEAWLAYDREGNGFFNKDRVLDGNDIFGDHLRKYPSGYEDLAETFAHEIKIDKAKQQFIPLRELPWWEQFWICLTRLFGFNKQANASYDLQLITSVNDVKPASSVITRIYVSYTNVEEYDVSGDNAILQRSLAVYKDEKSAWSGDQWFKPQDAILLMPKTVPQNAEAVGNASK